MNKVLAILTLKLIAVGVVASIRYIPNEGEEDGGFIATVSKIGDITPAEAVATRFQADYGITVLIAF